MAWRSNPLVFQWFYIQKEPLKWGEHIVWIRSRDKYFRNFVIEFEGRRVGGVTVSHLDEECPEIGYYIGEVTLWGKGVGREAVRIGMEWIRCYGKKCMKAAILDTNIRSIRLVESLGFKNIGTANEGESWYQVELRGQK